MLSAEVTHFNGRIVIGTFDSRSFSVIRTVKNIIRLDRFFVLVVQHGVIVFFSVIRSKT
jgi:hypothetical protein